MRLKRILLLALVALTAHCSKGSSPTEPAGPPAAPPKSVYLNVPFANQQTQEWCWAASIQMVSQFYGTSLTQCGVLSSFLGGDCCFAFNPICIQPAGSLATISLALRSFAGVQSAQVGRPLTFPEVSSEISRGHPIIAAYRGSFAGHVVVIYGYNSANNTVAINDPAYFGPLGNVPYGATFTYANTLVWADSLVTSR